MDTILKKNLSAIEFGKAQSHKDMTVVPLMSPLQPGVVYVTMQEALQSGAMSITEVSEGGSVPDLKVNNRGDFPVLILDGEELEGAKQNRIVNTSILIKVKWEGTIPVSCTEQGRWHHVSPEFHDSEILMSREIRSKKMRAVHRNLETERQYSADQSEVWDGIAYLRAGSNAPSSPTDAMKDIFVANQKSLDEYLSAFSLVEKQNGILVLLGGAVVGLDMVSLDSAYRLLHGKLIKSYAMAAIVESTVSKAEKPILETAREFIEKAKSCKDKKFESIGYGFDHRLKGDDIVGSSLSFNGDVIHMAFFRDDEPEPNNSRIVPFIRRRGFRM